MNKKEDIARPNKAMRIPSSRNTGRLACLLLLLFWLQGCASVPPTRPERIEPG